MRAHAASARNNVHSEATIFPLALLAVAPLLDLVRVVTRESAWSRVSFFVAFVGVVAAAVIVLPELLDWLALDRHSAARRAAAPALALRGAGVALFAVSVLLRLQSGALQFAALSFALVVAGAVAFAAGATSRSASPSAGRRATAPVA